MNEDGNIIFKNPPRIVLSRDEFEKYKLQDGDILITRSGTIGRVAIFKDIEVSAIPSAYLIRLRVLKNLVLPEYLLAFLLSPQGQAYLLEGATAVTQSNINAQKIRQFSIPLAPLIEQKAIFNVLEKFLSVFRTNEKDIDNMIQETEKLRQSILREAFSGCLVPQEPTDEPAEKLLEHIKAEGLSNKSKNNNQLELSKYVK